MRYHLSCLRLVNSKITELLHVSLSLSLSSILVLVRFYLSSFALPSQILDNATVLQTMDEGLEVGGEASQGIQCVNCGV